MARLIHLAPVPQLLDASGGTHTLARDRTIVLVADASSPGGLVAALRLRDAIERYAGVRYEIRAASGLAEREGVVAAIDRRVEKREGYHLTIGEERIGIVARDAPGLAYAFATLTQLVRQFGRRLPQLHIEDHPDFAHRGVMLDITEQLDVWYGGLVVTAAAAASSALPRVTSAGHRKRVDKLMLRLEQLCANTHIAWAFAAGQEVQPPPLRTLH